MGVQITALKTVSSSVAILAANKRQISDIHQKMNLLKSTNCLWNFGVWK